MSESERYWRFLSRSAVMALAIFLLAEAASLALVKSTSHPLAAAGASVALISLSLLAAAVLLPASHYPRWVLMASSFILAGSLVVHAAVSEPAGWGHAVIGQGWWAWFYLYLLDATPKSGPRWCSSPVVAIGTAVFLGAIMAFTSAP